MHMHKHARGTVSHVPTEHAHRHRHNCASHPPTKHAHKHRHTSAALHSKDCLWSTSGQLTDSRQGCAVLEQQCPTVQPWLNAGSRL